jgi:hypothetical protein
MPLFLSDLAPLVGKDENTLAQWCERGGVIPGAYRTQGGAKRRGKWRVAVPPTHPDDLELARARSQRDRIEVGPYVALLTIERLCNQIASNARKFSRDSSRRDFDRRKSQLVAEIAADDRRRGARVIAIDAERFERDSAVSAIEMVVDKKSTDPAYGAALSAQIEGRAPRNPSDLHRFGNTIAGDPVYGIAVAAAAEAYQRNDPGALTVEGLANRLGYSTSDLARRADLSRKIGRALDVVRGYARARSAAAQPDLDSEEQKELRRRYHPGRRHDAPGEEDRPRRSWGGGEEIDRKQLQDREIAKWIESLPPEERARIEAMPEMRSMIRDVLKKEDKRKRREATSSS